jgi:hypothetical protein
MPEYRLYCVSEHGRFIRAHEFKAASDKKALALARDLKFPLVCELWQQDRMVAKLDPHDG